MSPILVLAKTEHTTARSQPARFDPRWKPAAIVLSIIVIGTLFRLWAGSAVGLGNGEAYHFSCAIRPRLSYFDHPPLAVLLANVSMSAFDSMAPLVLRAPFILFFAGTTWLLYSLGRKLFGAPAGMYAALLLNLSAVFTLSVGCFLQSDGPLMIFWLASVCCLAKLFFDNEVRHPHWWWALVGVTLGLALLSKYHAVFLVFGAGVFALTHPDGRRWICHPGPYLAMAIAGVIFTPVLVWNYQHEWISFLWQGSRGLQSKGLRFDWLARNIGGQALWLLPWIWAPLIWELPRCFRQGPKDKERWFIAWLAVAPIAVFTVISVYAPIGFHFHWQAPGYLLLFLALGQTLQKKLEDGSRLARHWLRGTAVFTAVALLFVTTHAVTGWWTNLGPQWLSKKMGEPDDPTLECLEYTTLEAAVAERGLLGRRDVFVFNNRWFQAGKVEYALKGRMPMLCLHPRDPRSWAFFDRSENWLGKDGLLVSTKKFLDDPVSYYGSYFERIIPLGTVEVPRGGKVAETLHLHLCQNLHTPFPKPY